MIPARTQCPDGWTAEYAGYLVSEARRYDRRSSYVCWDEAPEVATGPVNQNNAVIYPVEVLCGSLPCSVYFTGRELTCIVCSKWQTYAYTCGWRTVRKTCFPSRSADNDSLISSNLHSLRRIGFNRFKLTLTDTCLALFASLNGKVIVTKCE